MTDIATRVYNHTWKIDPIVRSVLDTDFYKLLMAQSILHHNRNTKVTFSLINRTNTVPIAKIIDETELKEQLDHIRTLSLTRGETTWLRGNTFYGKLRMFTPEFIDWFSEFRFPPYQLERIGDQYELTFEGPWIETTMWEIPALSVLMELRSRAVLKNMGKFELQVLYAQAMSRVWEKIQRLNKLENLNIADFGTRRRHGFLWQDWCVQAMIEGLHKNFIGTSNCLIALRREVEAVGTNAHELPMVYAALAETDTELREAPYKVLSDWQEDYGGNLLIILPDTFGTKNFLDQAPDWLNNWTGMRVDSGDPFIGGNLAIDWWQRMGQDPKEKLLIFSDALDVDTIEQLHQNFSGRVQLGFGWGTLLTNDFRSMVPSKDLDPLSLVCKVTSANGKMAVKLSDNPNKAIGPKQKIEFYKRIFNTGKQVKRPVIV